MSALAAAGRDGRRRSATPSAVVRDGDDGLAIRDGARDLALFRARVREELRRSLVPLLAEAERERRFPRQAIAALGRSGLLRERWAGGGHGDLRKAMVLAEELGCAGLGGIGVGVSLHLEAALGILTRFARTDLARARMDGALDGELVSCVATSERDVGSDLTAVESTLEPVRGGWRVRGRKWFVSPGAAADFALVLCRCADTPGRRLRVSPLALAIVDREGLRVERTLETAGMRALGTVRLEVDAVVPDDAIVGRPGLGLLEVSWGLTHERLAIAAQTLGTASLALSLATTHLHRRRQFGVRLVDHQALRLRLADLAAQVELARAGVHATAASIAGRGADATRIAAGAKVTATRLAERTIGECVHFFGGTGYLEDETPLARLWRDTRVGRLGAGSDEMMWELVAGGLEPHDAIYDAMVATQE